MISLTRPALAAWFVLAVASGQAPLTLAFLCGVRVPDVVSAEDNE